MPSARHLRALYTLPVVLAAAPAFAQDEGAPGIQPGVPLKKQAPFLDRRALAIPGKIPPIQQLQPRTAQSDPVPDVEDTPAGGKAGAAGGPGSITREAAKNCVPMKPTDKITFEWKGADIKDVVTSISKTMCKNFILTQKVRSQKFDILSPTQITVEEAWRAFLSSLEANDFAIYQVGRYYKIIQATDATRTPVPIYEDGERPPNTDAMLTKIWKLKYAGDINAVVNYLNIFKSGKGQIHPFQATNTIVATDYGTSMVRLERILSEIDQPGALERVHVIPVEFASATEIAEKLNQIFEPQKNQPGAPRQPAKGFAPAKQPGAQGKGAEDEGGAVSKIIPDDRTNKLIVIASPASLKQVLALKKHLDVPAEGGDSVVHVLRLRFANAEELASTLSSLAQGKPTSGATGRTRLSRTSGAKPATPAAPPPGGAAAGGGSVSLFEGDVKITSDKPTNSLVITASKVDYNSIRKVIAELDLPRYQVFVEAVILEVTLTRDRTLGVTWHGGVAPEINGEQSPVVFGSAHKDFSSLQISTNPLQAASLLGLAGVLRGPAIPGTSDIFRGGIPAIGVVVQALQSTNDVNVISTPHLLTMDNEEAEIQVNEKRPFSSGVNLGGLGGLGNLSSLAGQAGGAAGGVGNLLGNLGGLGLGSVQFQREDVGLTLKLKPQINDQEHVRLEIDQELSDVAGTDQITGQIITSKRAAKTVVVVRDQDSVVIGGLVRDRESKNESKTPLLGDLPLIGWLFKRQQKMNDKVNLLLILTPYIIRGPEDFRKIYERKMAERKEFVERFYGETPEYRAGIDWTRKMGVLAKYRADIREELLKAENEGPGQEGETVVKPEYETIDVGGGGGSSQTPAPGQQGLTPGEGVSPTPPIEPPPPPPDVPAPEEEP